MRRHSCSRLREETHRQRTDNEPAARSKACKSSTSRPSWPAPSRPACWATTARRCEGRDAGRRRLPRALAPHKDGAPLWWKVTNRNKRASRSIFASPRVGVCSRSWWPGTRRAGREFPARHARRLGNHAELAAGLNPRLTILRVTGFGQDGPYADRPGFARIFEAMSGFTQICGEEDGRPLHLGYPISDAVAGLFGALGILAALHDLARIPAARPGDRLFGHGGDAAHAGVPGDRVRPARRVRTRSGNRSQYAAPGNVYRTADDKWASIAASTQSIFVVCAPRSAEVTCWRIERFAPIRRGCRNYLELDEIVGAAIGRLTLAELRETLHPPRSRLLADLRHRRRLRRSAVRRRARLSFGARRRAGLGADAGRGTALFRNTGCRAPCRPGNGPAQRRGLWQPGPVHDGDRGA